MKTLLRLGCWASAAALSFSTLHLARAQVNGPNGAVSLDGASGYVSVPNGVWFSNNFTIEGWVYARSYNSWSRLIDFSDGPNNYNVYLSLTTGANGLPTMGSFLANNGTPTFTSGTQLPLNQWAHLAATLSNTTGTIYINGTNVGTGTLNIPPNVVRSNNYIGRSAYTADSYANAEFDDIRIWNVARTQAQLQDNMHRSLIGNESGLIGYWRFDESSGTSALDSSGHGQTATLEAATTRVVSGAPLSAAGEALSFNGNGQIVTFPHKAYLNALPMTAMAWFNDPVTNTGGGGALINKYTSASTNGFQIAIAGQLHAWYYGASGVNTGNLGAGAVNDGKWHNAALAVDTNGGRLYLDGVLVSSNGWTGTNVVPCSNTNPMYIGLYPGDSFLSGQVDEVSLWNAALTTSQIQTYMNTSLAGTETNLIAYYRLDEGSGTTTLDLTTNGNTGTLSGNGNVPPTWVLSGAPLGAPHVATQGASGQTLNSVTLNGTINPAGQNAGTWFQWGPTTNYGSTTPVVAVGSGTATVTNTAVLSGLTLGSTNHFRVVGTNFGDTNYSADTTFVMGPLAPSISSSGASNIATTTATLTAQVTPNGAATTVYFIYGPTTAYGVTNAVSGVGGGTNGVLVTNNLSGLSLNTTYHYLIAASNSAGITTTADATFATTSPFTSVGAGLYAVSGISAAFADFNNDGWLDVVETPLVYSNNGNGSFTANSGYLESASYGTQVWGDFYNDGGLEVLVTGTQNNANPVQTTLYRVNTNGTTSANSSTGLPNCFESSIALGDFDNDGKLDVLMEGYVSDNNYVAGIWRNNGNGTFSPMPGVSLQGVYFGGVACGDFDNDGYLDFIITGQNQSSQLTQLWRNNGDGTFTQISVPGLPTYYTGSVAVGDFNNDGLLDFIITGTTFGNNDYLTQIWTNTGHFTFALDTSTSFPGTYLGRLAVGDFDNDGKLDFVLAGPTSYNPPSPITQVWENLGGGNFTNAGVNFPAYQYNSVAVGDFNNDGRLDILQTGYASGGAVDLERNNAVVTNTPPTAPSGLRAIRNGAGVLLAWNPATDAQTPPAGLSYNIRVGTTPGGLDVVPPESNTTNGFRRVPQIGNAQERLTAVLNLPAGTYYWSVQAVDSAFAGSAFAPEAQFTVSGANGPLAVTLPAVSITNGGATLEGTINPEGADTSAWFRWGTTTNYGNSTAMADQGGGTNNIVAAAALQGLAPSATYHYQVAASNANGVTYGQDSAFTTTMPVAPQIISAAASNVIFDATTLAAAVNPEGANTAVYFIYGLDTAYGTTNVVNNIGNGTSPVAVSNNLAGLLPNTVYHFLVVASNSLGVAATTDASFQTPAGAPAVTTLAVSNITANGATLSASVNPEGGDTTVSFSYGTTTNYGTTNAAGDIGAGVAPVIVSNTLINLSPVTRYHFAASGANYAGVTAGGDSTFMTPPGVPVISGQMATLISINSTALSATVNPGGADTRVYFCYGTDTNYGTTNFAGDIGGGTNGVPVIDTPTNLAPSTLYHFLVLASNSVGAAPLVDFTFTTPSVFSPVPGLPATYDFGFTPILADFNGDGLLDVLNDNILELNQGGGVFSPFDFGGEPVYYSAEAAADFENDGFLDILLTSEESSPETQLWHNNGDGTYTQVVNCGLPNLAECGIAIGDFDNDGRLDVLLDGVTNYGVYGFTGLYHNNGNGTFSRVNIPGLPGLDEAAAACGDFNNDGYLDFIISGRSTNNYADTTEIWRNNGDGTFSQVNVPGLAQVSQGSFAVGDFNNDGRLDFLVSGFNGFTPVTQLWSNGGNWNFTLVTNSGLPNMYYGTTTWGDFNNDGQLDLLLDGESTLGGGNIAEIWENVGGGSFTNLNAGFPNYGYPGGAVGDYNNDGRLDVVLAGLGGNNGAITLEQNYTPASNTPPASPSGLQASVTGSGVVLTWNAASDAQTPAAGLNYNIRVGTSPGGLDAVTPESDPATGFRRLAQIGNAGENLKSILMNLSAGTYYWSVQAIDTAFAGSPFAAEAQFVIAPPGPVVVTGATGQITSGSAVLNGTVNPVGGDTTAFFQYGPTTNLGGATASILVNGTNSGPVAVSLVANGLSPLTAYYYRIAGSNTGAAYGAISNFTTIATVPPNITEILNEPGNGFLLQFMGESGLGYTLQDSTNLINWSVVTNLTAGTNGAFQYNGSNTNNSPAIYFRLSRP